MAPPVGVDTLTALNNTAFENLQMLCWPLHGYHQQLSMIAITATQQPTLPQLLK